MNNEKNYFPNEHLEILNTIASMAATKLIQVQYNVELKTHQKDLEDLVAKRTSALQKTALELRASRKKLEESNRIIVKAHNDFLSSLKYAQRIQRASIPSELEMSKAFKDHFVLYKPRDVVSGDFYWLHKSEYDLILVLADCTGHGVPGALMSMAGHEQLDTIVVKRQIRRPDVILEELDQSMANLLKRKDAVFNMDDGMDISVVHIDLRRRTFSFSGAQTHGLFIQAEKEIQLRGSKSSIGGTHAGDYKEFSRLRFEFAAGDKFYLYTDGMYDQFGGPNGKKMLRKRFESLLRENAELSFREQGELLNDYLVEWRGTEPQVDDISVIGIKL